MKLRNNYTLTGLAGEYVAVPLDENAFSGIVKLNESGAEVFKALQEGLDENQIVARLMAAHDIDEALAQQAVKIVIDKLNAAGLME